MMQVSFGFHPILPASDLESQCTLVSVFCAECVNIESMLRMAPT